MTYSLNRCGEEIRDHERSPSTSSASAEAAIEQYCTTIALAVTGHTPGHLIGTSFLAPYLVPRIARAAGVSYSVPPCADSSNAVGVAVSRYSLALTVHADSGRRRLLVNGAMKEYHCPWDDEALVAYGKGEVRRMAVSAGASLEDLDRVEISALSSYDVIRAGRRESHITDLVVGISPGVSAVVR
ncbi:MAG: hypothetical protein NT074_08980 [Methanomicrobiales archaeon]|nr:hypothetical protein [Methanomicrobiales archaeon]